MGMLSSILPTNPKTDPHTNSGKPSQPDLLASARTAFLAAKETVGQLFKDLSSWTVEKFSEVLKQGGEEKFKKTLQEYNQQSEVKQALAEVDELVTEGYLSPDLGLAFKEKITGATGVVNSREHRSMVSLTEANRALGLIRAKVDEIEKKELSSEDLQKEKTELSLRVRLAFDTGGFAAVSKDALDKNVTTIFQEKLFGTDALDMSHDELWKRYQAQIMEMADGRPEDIISYLAHPSLNDSGVLEKAKDSIRAEQQLLLEIFGDRIEQERQSRAGMSSRIYNAYELNSGAAGGFSSLLNFISMGEGEYNSGNLGTRGGRIIGSTHDASQLLGSNLTDMTIGEVMEAQRQGRIFATGRYQIIPSTMELALQYSGLQTGDMFSPENQDKLAIALIMYKRPAIGQFIRGDTGVSIEEAALALAMEWASVPDYRTGNSYYDDGSGNKSSHSVDAVFEALRTAKQELSA